MFGASLKAPSRTFPQSLARTGISISASISIAGRMLNSSKAGKVCPENRPVYFDDARGNFNRVERGEIQKRYIVIP